MKKAISLSALMICLLLVLLVTGCSFASGEKRDNPKRGEKSYVELMNERIVSFADSADSFSGSLEKIAGSKSAPSDRQIEELESGLDALEAACRALAGQKATAGYVEAQKQLDQAVADYGEAFAKCRALLDFFRRYDEEFHEFKDPAAGSREMEKRERALYGEFAEAMLKASASFRKACEEFDKIRK